MIKGGDILCDLLPDPVWWQLCAENGHESSDIRAKYNWSLGLQEPNLWALIGSGTTEDILTMWLCVPFRMHLFCMWYHSNVGYTHPNGKHTTQFLIPPSVFVSIKKHGLFFSNIWLYNHWLSYLFKLSTWTKSMNICWRITSCFFVFPSSILIFFFLLCFTFQYYP